MGLLESNAVRFRRWRSGSLAAALFPDGLRRVTQGFQSGFPQLAAEPLNLAALPADFFEEFFLRLNSSTNQKSRGLRAAAEEACFDKLIEPRNRFVSQADHDDISALSFAAKERL
jgi:hypothetical protein